MVSTFFFFYDRQQTQQLQMQPMSRPDVNPGATETQQMRITAPTGVSIEPLYRVQRRFSFQLTDSFLFGGAPHTGQHPATHTNIVFDGWAAHPRSSRLFRISSRSHGLKCRFGFVLFVNPCLSSFPFPLCDARSPPLLSVSSSG